MSSRLRPEVADYRITGSQLAGKYFAQKPPIAPAVERWASLSGRPEVTVSEGPAGAGFHVTLKLSCLFPGRECDIGAQRPREKLGSMGNFTRIVRGEPGFKVDGQADVALGRVGFTLKQINVMHCTLAMPAVALRAMTGHGLPAEALAKAGGGGGS